MKVVSRFAVMFYVLFVMFLGSLIILFTLNKIPYDVAGNAIYLAYNDQQTRISLGGAGVVLLFINFIFMRAISVNKATEKTIAFDNPAGRVSVSLSALEDLTRRVVLRVPEVKEVRSVIKAGKNKVLEINVRIILKGDINIPEMTSSVQDLVRHKLEETIGIEKSPIVRVHVSKIFPKELKIKKQKDPKELKPETDPNIPFQGYRA